MEPGAIMQGTAADEVFKNYEMAEQILLGLEQDDIVRAARICKMTRHVVLRSVALKDRISWLRVNPWSGRPCFSPWRIPKPRPPFEPLLGLTFSRGGLGKNIHDLCVSAGNAATSRPLAVFIKPFDSKILETDKTKVSWIAPDDHNKTGQQLWRNVKIFHMEGCNVSAVELELKLRRQRLVKKKFLATVTLGEVYEWICAMHLAWEENNNLGQR